MRKNTILWIMTCVLSFVLAFFPFTTVNAMNVKDLKSEQVVSGSKWKIPFSWKLDKSTITSNSVYVKDSKGVKIPVQASLNMDRRTIVLSPKGLKPGSYFAYVTSKVKRLGPPKSAQYILFEVFHNDTPFHNGTHVVIHYGAKIERIRIFDGVRITNRCFSRFRLF